jgi:lipoyl-dependent peroxiredoxin
MPIRTAEAEWKGNIAQGSGEMSVGSGAFKGKYSVGTRFENAAGTNPEELIGAAHAGCFSMALTAGMSRAGVHPTSVHTNAKVHIDNVDGGWSITKIELDTVGVVPGIDQAKFQEFADSAKKNCPVSKALAGTTITLTATLKA